MPNTQFVGRCRALKQISNNVKMKKLIYVLLILILFSCRKDDDVKLTALESKLVGVWNGYQTVNKYDHHDDIIRNRPPYSIAFPYANGVEILDNGTLYGRIADNMSDPNTKFRRAPAYLDTWQLLNDNTVRLAHLEYSIISVTDKELVLFREVNSSSSETIKLRRE